MLDGKEANETTTGSRNIYKALAKIVKYQDDVHRGLQKIADKNVGSAGRV